MSAVKFRRVLSARGHWEKSKIREIEIALPRYHGGDGTGSGRGGRPEASTAGATNSRKFADTDNRLIVPLKRTAHVARRSTKRRSAARNQEGQKSRDGVESERETTRE